MPADIGKNFFTEEDDIPELWLIEDAFQRLFNSKSARSANPQ